MAKVHIINIGNSLSNLSYIVEYGNNQAICIDPTKYSPIKQFIEENSLNLEGIIVTHSHPDHVGESKDLAKDLNCPFLISESAKDKIFEVDKLLKDDEEIFLDEFSYIRVLETPGHTKEDISLILVENNKDSALFSGDVLFNAGVGNCFSGDVYQLYNSVIEKLLALDDEVKLYPGHNYMEKNLDFSSYLESENKELENFKDMYKEKTKQNEILVTSLGDEKKINPFLRLRKDSIRNKLKEEGYKISTDESVFLALRDLRNSW